MNATKLLLELNRRHCEVLTDGEDLVIHFDAAAPLPKSLVSELRTHKAELLNLLDGNVEFIPCPGNDCIERIMLVDRQGYCYRHNMLVTIIDESSGVA